MKKLIKSAIFVAMFSVLAIVVFPVAAQIKTVDCGEFGIACGTTAADLKLRIQTIVNICLSLVGVIAGAMIVYGGFLYVVSGVDEGNAKKGKQIIIYAVIGLIIIGLATTIVNFIMGPPSDELKTRIVIIVNTFLGLVGVIAGAMIIWGGFLYVTSGVDEDNAKKGKQIVTYAVVGLIIIGLSVAIVNFVVGPPRSSGSGTANPTKPPTK